MATRSGGGKEEAMLCRMTASHWREGQVVPTYFVSLKPRRGCYRRLRDAIQQIPPYSRVEVVGGGLFPEKIVLDKPVEIGVSSGSVGGSSSERFTSTRGKTADRTRLDESEAPCLVFRTTPLTLQVDEAFVEGLRVVVESSAVAAVAIVGGSPVLRGCAMTSVEVSGSATPTVQECRITSSTGSGLVLLDHAAGTYSRNIVGGHTEYSVLVSSTAAPTFLLNTITESAFGQICIRGAGGARSSTSPTAATGEDGVTGADDEGDGGGGPADEEQLVRPTFLMNRVTEDEASAGVGGSGAAAGGAASAPSLMGAAGAGAVVGGPSTSAGTSGSPTPFPPTTSSVAAAASSPSPSASPSTSTRGGGTGVGAMPTFMLDALPVKEAGMVVSLLHASPGGGGGGGGGPQRGKAGHRSTAARGGDAAGGGIADDADVAAVLAELQGDHGVQALLTDTRPDRRCAVLITGARARPVFSRNNVFHCRQHGVVFRAGAAGTVEANTISTNKGWGLLIEGAGTAPVLVGNHIASNGGGARVSDGAAARFMDGNLFVGNRGPQLLVNTGSPAFLLERSVVRSGSRVGVWCTSGGEGTLRGNEFEGCGVGVLVEHGANPLLQRNTFDGGAVAVYAHHGGRGRCEDCQITDQSLAGVVVAQAAHPTFTACLITSCGVGIVVTGGGRGRFERCVVREALRGGVDVSHGGDPVVHSCEVLRGRADGLRVWRRGRGCFEHNVITGNDGAQVSISQGGDPLLLHNVLGHASFDGVTVTEGGLGVLVQNIIRRCYSCGIAVEGAESAPVVRSNYVADCAGYGLRVTEAVGGTYEKNVLLGCGRASVGVAGEAVSTATNTSAPAESEVNGNDSHDPHRSSDQPRVVLRGNLLRGGGGGGSAWCGVVVERHARVLLVDNVIREHVQGVSVRGGADLLLLRNHLSNGDYGLVADDGAVVCAVGNHFGGLRQCGAASLHTRHCELRWNTFRGCGTAVLLRRVVVDGVCADNAVTSSTGFGLYLGADCRCTVTRNVLSDNVAGIALAERHGRATVSDNAVVRCRGPSLYVNGDALDQIACHGNALVRGEVGVAVVAFAAAAAAAAVRRSNVVVRDHLIVSCRVGVRVRLTGTAVGGDRANAAASRGAGRPVAGAEAGDGDGGDVRLQYCYVTGCSRGVVATAGRWLQSWVGGPGGCRLEHCLLTGNDVAAHVVAETEQQASQQRHQPPPPPLLLLAMSQSVVMNSAAVGVLVQYPAARGVFSGCVVSKNLVNVAVVSGARPSFTQCVLHAAVVFNVYTSDQAAPRFSNCLITSHAAAAASRRVSEPVSRPGAARVAAADDDSDTDDGSSDHEDDRGKGGAQHRSLRHPHPYRHSRHGAQRAAGATTTTAAAESGGGTTAPWLPHAKWLTQLQCAVQQLLVPDCGEQPEPTPVGAPTAPAEATGATTSGGQRLPTDVALLTLPSLWDDLHCEPPSWRCCTDTATDGVAIAKADPSAAAAVVSSAASTAPPPPPPLAAAAATLTASGVIQRAVKSWVEQSSLPFPCNGRRSAVLWPANLREDGVMGGPGGPFLLHRARGNGVYKAKSSTWSTAPHAAAAGSSSPSTAPSGEVYVCAGIWIDTAADPLFEHCLIAAHTHLGATGVRRIGPRQRHHGSQLPPAAHRRSMETPDTAATSSSGTREEWIVEPQRAFASRGSAITCPLSVTPASSSSPRKAVAKSGGRAATKAAAAAAAIGATFTPSLERNAGDVTSVARCGSGSREAVVAGGSEAALYTPPLPTVQPDSVLGQLLLCGSPCYWRQCTPGPSQYATVCALLSAASTATASGGGGSAEEQRLSTAATEQVAGYGVLTRDAAVGGFVHCTFAHNTHAAWVSRAATTSFKHCRLHGQTNLTLRLEDGAAAVVQGCTFRGSHHCQIRVSGATTTSLVERNEFAEAPFTAVLCADHCKPVVQHNRFHAITTDAVVVQGGATPTVERNRFDQCRVGVLLESGGAGSIVRNTFAESAEAAVVVKGCGTTPQIVANHIRGGRVAGVVVSGAGAAPQVRGNYLTDNVKGIVVCNAAGGTFSANTLLRHEAGVVIEAAAGEYSGNRVEESVVAGVVVCGVEAAPVVVHNEVLHGVQVGLRVENSSQGLLARNHVALNGGDGCVVDGLGSGAQCMVVGNVLDGNGGVGVRVRGGARPTLSCNVILRNERGGVRVEGAGTAPLLQGTFAKANRTVGLGFALNAGGWVDGGVVSHTQGGPAVLVEAEAHPHLSALVVADNHGEAGGVLVHPGGVCEAVNCLFACNSAAQADPTTTTTIAAAAGGEEGVEQQKAAEEVRGGSSAAAAFVVASAEEGSRIAGCVFVENSLSLLVQRGGQVSVEGCAFLGPHTSTVAVRLVKEASPVLKHCWFAQVRYGVRVEGANAKMHRCLFTDCHCGLDVVGSCSVYECEFRRCVTGVRVTRGQPVVMGCVVANCTKVGVHITEDGQPVVEESGVMRCQRGVLVDGRAGGTLRANRVLWNTDNVVIADLATPGVEGNFIFDAANIGIHVKGGQPAVVNNDVFDNHYAGVLVEGTVTGGKLEDNRICFAREDGALVVREAASTAGVAAVGGGEGAAANIAGAVRGLSTNNNIVRNHFTPPTNPLFRAVGERQQLYHRAEVEEQSATTAASSVVEQRRFVDDHVTVTLLRACTLAATAMACVADRKEQAWAVQESSDSASSKERGDGGGGGGGPGTGGEERGKPSAASGTRWPTPPPPPPPRLRSPPQPSAPPSGSSPGTNSSNNNNNNNEEGEAVATEPFRTRWDRLPGELGKRATRTAVGAVSVSYASLHQAAASLTTRHVAVSDGDGSGPARSTRAALSEAAAGDTDGGDPPPQTETTATVSSSASFPPLSGAAAEDGGADEVVASVATARGSTADGTRTTPVLPSPPPEALQLRVLLHCKQRVLSALEALHPSAGTPTPSDTYALLLNRPPLTTVATLALPLLESPPASSTATRSWLREGDSADPTSLEGVSSSPSGYTAAAPRLSGEAGRFASQIPRQVANRTSASGQPPDRAKVVLPRVSTVAPQEAASGRRGGPKKNKKGGSSRTSPQAKPVRTRRSLTRGSTDAGAETEPDMKAVVPRLPPIAGAAAARASVVSAADATGTSSSVVATGALRKVKGKRKQTAKQAG